MGKFWQTNGKAIIGFLIAVITALQAVLPDGHIDRTEGVQVAIAAVTAVLVWFAPIHPEWPWIKTVVAVVLAGLNAVVTIPVGGFTASDFTVIVLALLTAVGVGKAPAVSAVRRAGSDKPGWVRTG